MSGDNQAKKPGARAPRYPSWTLKGQPLTPELKNAVRMAAKRQRVPQVQWVARVLHEAANRVLAGLEEGPAPSETLPARMDERLTRLEQQLEEECRAGADRQERLERMLERMAQDRNRNPIEDAFEAGQKAVSGVVGWVFGTGRR